MSDVRIVPAGAADGPALQALRLALWPDADDATGEAVAFLARGAAGEAIGFAEASLRHDYVNGCETSPVAFLEGLFVAPSHRRRGIARALVDAVAAWARGNGMRELASDAALDNVAAHLVHRAAGFEETERVVYFRRALAPK